MPFLMCTKRSYCVGVYRPPLGTPVHNFLEDADYVASEEQPFVIVGTMGEKWAISKEKLVKTYQISEDGADAITDRVVTIFTRIGQPIAYWAELVPIEKGIFTVQTSWGTELIGNRPGVMHCWGDVIVAADDHGKPSDTDRWIVNGAVFINTYNLSTTGALNYD